MKLQVITCIATSMLMVSCGGDSDSLTAELNELNELEKSNEVLAENAEALTEEATIASEMYESEDGRFKVNFLGATPEISTESVPTELGDIEITMFLSFRKAFFI